MKGFGQLKLGRIPPWIRPTSTYCVAGSTRVAAIINPSAGPLRRFDFEGMVYFAVWLGGSRGSTDPDTGAPAEPKSMSQKRVHRCSTPSPSPRLEGWWHTRHAGDWWHSCPKSFPIRRLERMLGQPDEDSNYQPLPLTTPPMLRKP